MALTDTDLKKIENIVDKKLDKRFEEQEEKIEALLTKHRSEFFTKIDPILKEVVASREERVLMNQRITNLEEARVQ